MVSVTKTRRPRSAAAPLLSLALLLSAAGCATSSSGGGATMSAAAPKPDPRVGLRAGLRDAGEAAWNLRLVSNTPAPGEFAENTSSDLAFTGNYAIQGNYHGILIWDISNPAKPALTTAFVCPASQNDVSVYRNLLFVSTEGLNGRVDCGTQGVQDTVSAERMRGIRVFDISDIRNPKQVATVQTCRGSHTHTVVDDPDDPENVYVYVSGSAGVRSPNELPGCSRLQPSEDPNSALFRIEVIRVPLANPERAAIVSSPRIFEGLVEPPTHGEAPEDLEARRQEIAEAKAAGMFIVTVRDEEFILPPQFADQLLDSVVQARQGTGAPTGADSAALRAALPGIIARMIGPDPGEGGGPRPGPSQCHDITVYPAIQRAGGACGGYGLLLDISDVANPKRIGAVADSNFSYWHSATFSNDGTKLLFSDEWGGGGQPKCRATDRPEWGANAIFTLQRDSMVFRSYFKLPAPQTSAENCVAHNGSLIPVPGRDIMVQAWYQGGITVFDWTDPARPREIAFFDRGPVDSTQIANGGAWSTYWYNGYIVSSEIGRGLDIFELTPGPLLTENEIAAAKEVRLEYLNVQQQPKLVWPASFSVARAYLDQLARSNGLASDRISAARDALARAERASAEERRAALADLASELEGEAARSSDRAKVQALAAVVGDLAGARTSARR